MATFKSDRAAKMAYTKAEKAYDAARAAVNAQTHEYRQTGWNEERFAVIRGLEAKASEALEAARAVYDAAKAQGICIRSWYFSHNPTRDLISANMD